MAKRQPLRKAEVGRCYLSCRIVSFGVNNREERIGFAPARVRLRVDFSFVYRLSHDSRYSTSRRQPLRRH